MDLNHEFTVPVPVADAWKILTDVERIAPCLPGAELQEVEGDTYRGVVKVKVGPIQAQFKGQASFVERDDSAHKAVLKGEGRDTGGKGNASALITAQLTSESAASTKVVVTTDLPADSPTLAEALATMRERVLARLEAVFPFFTRHLIVVDSIHDGLPLWDYRSGTRLPIQRLSAGLAAPEPMPVRWRVGYRGLDGRLPWYRTLFVNRGGHWVVDARAAARFGAEEPFVAASVVGHALRRAYPQKDHVLAPWKSR